MDTAHVLFKEIPFKLMMIYCSLALVMFCSLSLSGLLLSSVELKIVFTYFLSASDLRHRVTVLECRLPQFEFFRT